MLPIELDHEFKNLLAHYKYKNNRIRAFVKEAGLSDYITGRIFKVSKRELFLILHKPKSAKKIQYNPVTLKTIQYNFNNHQLLSQKLIRLR